MSCDWWRSDHASCDWSRGCHVTLLLARTIPGQQSVTEYKQVNRRESVEVADAFLSYNFLDNQVSFLRSKGKLYCTVLCCTVLYCSVLYCTGQVPEEQGQATRGQDIHPHQVTEATLVQTLVNSCVQ